MFNQAFCMMQRSRLGAHLSSCGKLRGKRASFCKPSQQLAAGDQDQDTVQQY